MEEFNPKQFRIELEANLNAAAGFEISDFAHLIEQKAAILGKADKRTWLQNELFALLNSPELNQYYFQKEVLPVQLDEMAEDPIYWRAWQQAGLSLDEFLTKVPFLRTVVIGKVAAGKVEIINRMLNESQYSFAQGSILERLGDNEIESLSFRQEVLKKGPAYYTIWNDRKEEFGDSNLSEERFILADMDHCKSEIEKWRNEDRNFKSVWISILQENIRSHKIRLAEIQRKPFKPKRVKRDTGKKNELEPLKTAVKDNETFLPALWKELSSMKKPLVSRSGKFIWEGENVSVLMALAQALVTAEKIAEGYTTEQIYRMLCDYFKEPASERPRIKANTGTGFTNVYSDSLTAFNDIINGL